MPPSTAASACTATRTMLFSGCCAVSVMPAVWAWKRSIWSAGPGALKRSRMMRAHMPPRRAELGHLLEEVVVGVEEEREPRREVVDILSPASPAALRRTRCRWPG